MTNCKCITSKCVCDGCFDAIFYSSFHFFGDTVIVIVSAASLMDTSLDDVVDARCAAMSFRAFSLVLHVTTQVSAMKGQGTMRDVTCAAGWKSYMPQREMSKVMGVEMSTTDSRNCGV